MLSPTCYGLLAITYLLSPTCYGLLATADSPPRAAFPPRPRRSGSSSGSSGRQHSRASVPRSSLLGPRHRCRVVLGVQVRVVDRGRAVAHRAAPALRRLLAVRVPRPLEVVPVRSSTGQPSVRGGFGRQSMHLTNHGNVQGREQRGYGAITMHGGPPLEAAGASSNLRPTPLVDVVRDANTDVCVGARRAMRRLFLLVLVRGLPYLGSKRRDSAVHGAGREVGPLH